MSSVNRVLLLNASYEPLCAVVMSRAINLLLQGKALVIESRDDEQLRSAHFAIPSPTVIRLERYVNLPFRRVAPLTRTGVLERDNYTCVYCGKDGRTIDHIVPKSRGGESSWLNLAACCQRCNNKKGDQLLDELGWQLRFTPHAPDYRSFSVSKLATKQSEISWFPYLSMKAA